MLSLQRPYAIKPVYLTQYLIACRSDRFSSASGQHNSRLSVSQSDYHCGGPRELDGRNASRYSFSDRNRRLKSLILLRDAVGSKVCATMALDSSIYLRSRGL